MSSIRTIFIVCALLGGYGACSTIADRIQVIEPANTRVLIENRITENIISDPLLAAQLIGYHRQKQGLFVSSDLDIFRPSLERTLTERLTQHVQQQEFNDAIALIRSMETIGSPIPQSFSVDTIRRMEAVEHLKQKRYLPLLFAIHHISDYQIFTSDELSQLLDIALRHNHRALIRTILDSIDTRYPTLAQRYRTAIQEPPTLTEMLEGTVTVWVDKGFTIVDGVGRPDRVFGSAFFVDERGYLITNYHVIASEVDPEYEGFSRLYIRLADNSDLRVPAKVVGYDRLLDIALLKTEIPPKYIFALEPYEKQYISGTQTYALGSPIGLDKSIASGIISSSSRQFLPIGEVLQIDAPVNPGNSGGPLIDDSGVLAGVVYAGIPQFQGINFAIPITWVWQIIPNLFSADNDNHLWLGVAVQEVENRLEVIYVTPGSPADEVGVKAGDIVTHINDNEVRRVSEAQTAIAAFSTSTLISVRWRINDISRDYPMKIRRRSFSPIEEALKFQRRKELFGPLFGMEADRIGGGIRSNRYVITKVHGATIADELGFVASDPFTLLRWKVDEEQRFVSMHIQIKKTKAGFTASGLQMIGRFDLANFI